MPKIRHIAISTEDPEKTAAFYKEAFGMQEVGRARSGVFLSDGEINFAILRIPKDDNPDEIICGVHHFGFLVEDPDATCRKLAELGAKRLPDQPSAGLQPASGKTYQQYFEVKHEGPDGVCVDISEHGWVGAKPLGE
jgi:methylmalonyl-CoA/ethylmalonyl-CoA epimerase